MSLNAGNVLKINITTDPKDTILEYVQKYLNEADKNSAIRIKKDIKPLVIVTPNPEQIVLAQQNIHFAKILNRADIAIPDGIGVVFAMHLFEKKSDIRSFGSSFQRIAGVDFMKNLVAIASKERVTIGLIGGRAGIAVKALECLRVAHSKLNGWAEDAPEFTIVNNELKMQNNDQKSQHLYFSDLASRIQVSKTQILFVGLGAPKQEYFIEQLVSSLPSTVNTPLILMSVGGSFDFISGKIQRAPQLARLMGFEWAWRLFQEPWRWKRQTTLLRFIWLLLKSKFTS